MIALLLLLSLIVQPAPEYEQLFIRDQGWTGADGTYSLVFPDGRVAWLFSDTFVGQVEPDRSRSPGWGFLHNSVALQDGGELKFSDLKQTFLEPPSGKGWYWMLDGWVTGPESFQVFLAHFEQFGKGVFDVRCVGGAVATVTLDLKVEKIQPMESLYRARPHPLVFGGGVCRAEDGLYVYGTEDDGQDRRRLYLACCDFSLENWKYWDGNDFQPDIGKATPLLQEISNEFSVHQEKGAFRLVYQHQDRILSRTAPAPHGPFSEPTLLYRTPETQLEGVFTYNAKAHPELSTSEKLLISYNVNAIPIELVVQNADYYRPRFRWVDR